MNDDKPRRIQVDLPDDLARRSTEAANSRGLSRSAWVRKLIEQALSRAGQ